METKPLAPSVAVRLSLMMFLQFFVWGAWYVTAPLLLRPLGFEDTDIAWTYSVGPIAGILSPFFVGIVADRFFATERVLGVMHLLGAAAMFGAIALMRSANPSPAEINWLFFVHMLCYFPTLALVNTLALHNLTQSERQFPRVRVFGTIGWIAAGWILSFWAWDKTQGMFELAAWTQLALGLVSFGLPHTPPPARGQKFSVREALGLDALVLLKRPSFLVFMASSFLICIPLAFYYQLAATTVDAGGIVDVARTMSYGQVSEIFFMVVMPFFFIRLGVKWMLAVGMLAWTARYFLFAFGVPDGVVWMLYLGVILHGICYDFFFVTGQLYTDRVAPSRIRGQAQGMLVLFTLGLGMLIGAQVAGQIEKQYSAPDKPALMAKVGELDQAIQQVRENAPAESAAPGAGVEASIAELRETRRAALVQAIDWKGLWLVPAIGAAAVLGFFAFAFRDDTVGKKPEDIQEAYTG